MNKIIKIKYKIEKEEIIYWTMFFFIVSILALLVYIVNKQHKLIYFMLIELIIPVIFLIYYFINLFRCKHFCDLCNKIQKNEAKINLNDCFIKIKRKEYSIKPIKQSIDVNIKTYFRTVKAYFVQTNDFLILFFQTCDFELFRRYIQPVVFMKNTTLPTKFMKNIFLIKFYEKKQ